MTYSAFRTIRGVEGHSLPIGRPAHVRYSGPVLTLTRCRVALRIRPMKSKQGQEGVAVSEEEMGETLAFLTKALGPDLHARLMAGLRVQ